MTENRMTLEILWVPGNMSVEGNKNADEVAKEAAEKAGTRRCPEMFASLTTVGRTISDRN